MERIQQFWTGHRRLTCLRFADRHQPQRGWPAPHLSKSTPACWRKRQHARLISEFLTCPLENGRRTRFYSRWVRTKTCPLFEFSVEGAKGPALQAIDEKPRPVAPGSPAEPATSLPFSSPWFEPKPVRFLNFPSKVRGVRRFRRLTKSRAG